jgi:hypothetical protein
MTIHKSVLDKSVLDKSVLTERLNRAMEMWRTSGTGVSLGRKDAAEAFSKIASLEERLREAERALARIADLPSDKWYLGHGIAGDALARIFGVEIMPRKDGAVTP